MKRTIAFCLLSVALGRGAQAAEPVPADSIAMTVPEVVVQALRGRDALRDIAAPAFLMTRSELVRAGTERAATVLGRLPGLHAYGSTGIGEPRVVDPRGFTANGESSYLKLVVNGQDVRGVENGDVNWDWILTDDVERLEVIQGPGAWAHGDGSQGGVVNVVRREPSSGFRSDCMLRAGSFGLMSGNLVGSGGSRTLRGGLRGSARVADGYRDRSEEQVYSGGADAAWSLSPASRLTFDVSVLDSRNEDPGALTADQLRADRDQADTQTDYVHSRRLATGLHFIHRPDSDQEWQISPYLRREEVDQIRTIFFEAQSHPTEATTLGGEANWRGRVGSVGLTAGAQAEHSNLQSDYRSIADGTLQSRSDGVRDSYAGFASARVPVGDRTSVRLGVRGDVIRVGPLERMGAAEIPDRTLSAASPFLALIRQIGSHASAWANASTAFRVPTLNQLFDQRVLGGSFVISNPNLDPQESLNFEIGLRRDVPGGAMVSLAVYSSQVRDEIDFDLATFSYANIGQSWHRGIEAALLQPIGGSLSATVNGAWSPTTIVNGDDDGNQINAVPEGTAYGALRWMRGDRWSVEGGVRYTGRQFLDKANLHALPDYATLELAASARLAGARLTLRVANLLDREYEESGFLGALGEERFYPAPGRSASLGLSLD